MALSRSSRKFLASEIEASSGFIVDPKKLTAAEADFASMAGEKMIAVHRPSWPDFLCLVDGKLIGVEVKAKGDWIRDNQRRTFDILERHKIMRVYIWDEWSPRKLVAWKKAKTRAYEAARRRKDHGLERHLGASNPSSESGTAQYPQPGLQASPSEVVSRH